MKAYGIRKKDTGCCFGHDKYQKRTARGNTLRGLRKKGQKPAKTRARQEGKVDIYGTVAE